MNIGGGHRYCMNQATVLVCTNMRFVAKVPGVAFLDLMRIRIPLLLLVFNRGRRGDDGRVNNRSPLQNQPPLHECCHNLREQLLLQSILHKQIPKASYGIPIRDLVA